MPSYRSSTLNGYALIFSYYITNQNQMTRESTISWKLELVTGAHQPTDILIGSATIGGVKVWDAPTKKFSPAEYKKQGYLGSGTLVLRHNNAGNLGITHAVSLKTKDEKAAWRMPLLTIEGSWQAPTIPPMPNRTQYRTNTANGYSAVLHLSVAQPQDTINRRSLLVWMLVIESTKDMPTSRLIGDVTIAGKKVWTAGTETNWGARQAKDGYVARGTMWVVHNPNGSLGITFAVQARTQIQTGATHIPQLTMTGPYQVLPALPPMPNRPAYKSNTNNGYSITLHLAVVSQDIKNNTTTMSWKLTLDLAGKTFRDNLVGSVVIAQQTVWTAPPQVFSPAEYRIKGYLGQGTVKIKHNNEGFFTATFGAGLRTQTAGQPWSVPLLSIQGLYQLPPVPKKPAKADKPIVTAENATTRQITIDVPEPEATTPITGYQIRMRNDRERPDWVTYTAQVLWRIGRLTLTPVSPIAAMEFQGRARTAADWGPWSDSITYIGVGTGPYVRSGGSWRATNAYVKMGENWRPALCYVRYQGKWRTVGR